MSPPLSPQRKASSCAAKCFWSPYCGPDSACWIQSCSSFLMPVSVFIGLKREEKTLKPRHITRAFPPISNGWKVILIDPMLATGGSTVAAMDLLSELGAKPCAARESRCGARGDSSCSFLLSEAAVYLRRPIDKKLNGKRVYSSRPGRCGRQAVWGLAASWN